MALSLDGNTSFIGTEFIKLLNTGSSDLATVEYVDEQVALGGGGGGNVDLSNYYTQTETDNLLNNKLNVNNPQDIIGNLRLDPTNGNSKIILNAVSPPNATDDFYCNGNGHFNGTLRVSILTSDGDVNCNGVNTDVFNSNVITNDIIFKHNDIEYMRFNADDNTIDLSTDLDLQTSELMCNNFNCSDFNDVVFNINTDEFLRFQLSDGTVRVPNTKAFLSQNIFTDIIKPLTFSNDVVLNGGNNTNDAYEEYVRLDASAEKVSISKETKFEDDIQLNVGQVIKFTNVFIREVQGTTRPEFDLIINGSTSHMRMWVAGAIRQAITNTAIACKVNIDAEQGITVFTGKELKTNTINSHTNSNLVIQRSGSTLITLNSSNQIQLSGDLSLPTSNTQYIRFNNCRIREGLAGVISYFDFINADTAGHFRFYLGEIDNANLKISIQPNIINLFNETVVNQKLQIITGYGLESNLIDTNGDNNLLFQRNGSPYMTFNTDRININQALHLSDTLFIDTANKLSLKPSLEGGVNIFDIRNLHPIVDNPMIRFRVGEGGGETIICEMTNNGVSMARNLIIGTAYELKTNAIDTNNDSPLIFNRNDNEIMRFETYTDVNSGNETYPLINVEATARLSCNHVYITHILNRAGQFDNTFQGSNADGTARVEYMRWNYANQSLDFNAPIDNTNISIIGNIIDTTVSDERLKTNIQDVESNYCDCIKNVKIKTFEYKDEKYKDSDKYGFIAQHLQKHLPKEFDNIVKETKPKKEEGEAYLSINYMKLSVVLWGALQETLTKVEHLEARLFELEDIVKDKKKPTPKSKAKAKSKSKAKNVD